MLTQKVIKARGTATSVKTLPLLLAALALMGGCLGSGPNAAPPTDSIETITDPRDRAYLSSPGAENETHIHDYWAQSSEVDLGSHAFQLSSLGIMNTVPRVPRNHQTAILLGEGKTVFPGAAWLNATATFASSDGLAKRLALSAVSPNKKPFGPLELQSGRTVSLGLNMSDWDLPHSTVSRWSFALGLSGSNSILPGGSVSGSISFKIARGNQPIPPSPTHRDFWNGSAALLLHRSEGPLLEIGGLGSTLAPGQQAPEFVANFSIVPLVPFDTKELHLRLGFNSSTPDAVHHDPRLSWIPADKRNVEGKNLPPTKRDATSRTWIVPVEARSWDSPYANNTAWSFILQYHQGGYPFGPTLMKGDWQLSLVAFHA